MARTKALAKHAKKIQNPIKSSDLSKPLSKKPKGHKTSQPPNAPENLKNKRKYRPGTVALREIKKYQKNTDLVIRKLPFQRLVRDIANDIYGGAKFQLSALHALQDCAEMYMCNLYTDGQLCALHGKRITLMVKDMQLAKRIRGDKNGDKGY